ncbi:MAG: glycosyltransferase, partial [Mycobacteriaceae bacterium]|nr:glycosyltransferase [Mycobacteriaceae bacterium]
MTTLERAFAVNSPRLTRRGAALSGWVIHVAVIGVWIALFAQVFLRVGAGMWSIGIGYIAYDTVLLSFVLWQTVPLRRPETTPARAGGPAPTLGVLIAAYDEATVLPATLRALLAQSDPPEAIVVADDGSGDDTGAVLQAEFGDRYPALRLLRLPHRGKAAALNAALLAVDTEVVITMDADTLPAPGAIAAIRGAF